MNRQPSGWRLVAWWVLVGSMILLAFSSAATAEEDETRNLVYEYEFGFAGIVVYALILALVLLIARGLDWRETFALRRPDSWSRAGALMLGTLVAVFAVGAALEAV